MRLVRTQGLIQNLPEADKQFGQADFIVVELFMCIYMHTHTHIYVCVYVKKKSTLLFPFTYCPLYTEI